MNVCCKKYELCKDTYIPQAHLAVYYVYWKHVIVDIHNHEFLFLFTLCLPRLQDSGQANIEQQPDLNTSKGRFLVLRSIPSAGKR